ncbi:U-box domain-containing protein 4 [Malania oleifera]|uniref:U-box domain-containing protein 4 n=1 Tax=Malania oleifera TaxID=397392 RepID=UPI0025AE6052|nr:U-box domain-containing protein 4 [Malania oleifera]
MEEIVLEALFSGDGEAQVQAATNLSKLSSRQRHKLAEKGVISPLLSMLLSQDFRAIEAALFALLSIAFGSERNKIRIVKSGTVPLFLRFLQCESESLIDLAVAALLTLSSCTANKHEIAGSGVIQHLIELLAADFTGDARPISLQAKFDAIATLHNLSTCKEITPLIVSSGIVSSLLQIISNSDKSSGLVEKATMLLESVVSSSETALREIGGEEGAIPAMVEAIEEGSAQCKESAVAILAVMCRSCRERNRGLILREGAMPGLLQLSVDGTARAKQTATELLWLLRDCSKYGSRRKKALKREVKVLEQVMEEINGAGVKEGTALRMVEKMIAKLSV